MLAWVSICTFPQRNALRQVSRKDPLGGVDDSDRTHGSARVVEDRGGRARLAEHRFVSLGGNPLISNRRHLIAQRLQLFRLWPA